MFSNFFEGLRETVVRDTTMLLIFSSIGTRERDLHRLHHRNMIRGGPGVSISSLPKDIVDAAEMPDHFDWRALDGKSYATPTQNQYSPDECGSCWAHAAASALSDRIKRLRNASWPDIVLSAQVLLNCADQQCTCDGGDPYRAYEYIYTQGVPDASCAAYTASVQSCTDVHTCRGLGR